MKFDSIERSLILKALEFYELGCRAAVFDLTQKEARGGNGNMTLCDIQNALGTQRYLAGATQRLIRSLYEEREPSP